MVKKGSPLVLHLPVSYTHLLKMLFLGHIFHFSTSCRQILSCVVLGRRKRCVNIAQGSHSKKVTKGIFSGVVVLEEMVLVGV